MLKLQLFRMDLCKQAVRTTLISKTINLSNNPIHTFLYFKLSPAQPIPFM